MHKVRFSFCEVPVSAVLDTCTTDAALLVALTAPNVEIVGISAVHGNVVCCCQICTATVPVTLATHCYGFAM